VSSGNRFPTPSQSRLPENIDGVYDILASRADGKSDVEWHGGRGMCKTVEERKERWLSHGGGALINRLTTSSFALRGEGRVGPKVSIIDASITSEVSCWSHRWRPPFETGAPPVVLILLVKLLRSLS